MNLYSRKSLVIFISICILFDGSVVRAAKDSGWGWTIGGAVLGAAGAVVAAPIVVSAAGFTAVGITAGSAAASMMSASAVASGGGVAAGGLVATCQAIGATGTLLAGGAKVVAGVATLGAAAGAAVEREFDEE